MTKAKPEPCTLPGSGFVAFCERPRLAAGPFVDPGHAASRFGRDQTRT